MPQANKKRGRRSGQKRKHEEADDGPELVEGSKRRKPSAAEEEQDFIQLETNGQTMDAAYSPMEKPFFGMLDEEEQEYFKRADDMLESNTFTNLEERSLFLSNLYREADGKELKIAQSQSCSRLMERLIQLSTQDQLKKLFQKFRGK
jgi:nucleolar protein 9